MRHEYYSICFGIYAESVTLWWQGAIQVLRNAFFLEIGQPPTHS